jgi:hypothetical protein
MNRKRIIIVITCLIIATILLAYLFFNVVMNKPTTLYVDPQTSETAVGQDFTVNISISNVADLFGWGSRLSWNATILAIVNETEGTFLRSHGTTFFYPTINTTGYLILDCTLTDNLTGVSGNGVLATIQFHVKESGHCDLDLYDTELSDSSEPPHALTHTVVNGQFSSTS